jgi:hypothetical protein
MDLRLTERALLSSESSGGVRHDPGLLAREVCEAVLVRL